MKKCIVLVLLSIFTISTYSQSKIENLVIITTDGLRWQEVFGGMDSSIANKKQFNKGDSTGIFNKYWAATPDERRQKLMPFLWSVIAKSGQIYGNRELNSNVHNANPYWFSYPGYSELMCGYVDEKINSNSYPNNPNENLLEFFNKDSKYKGKISMYGAWEAFNRIMNEPRCCFPVVASFDTVAGKKMTEGQRLINQMLKDSYRPWGEGECLDVFTHYFAMEDLKNNKPKVLYVAYGETDEWGHAGQYKHYLNAAQLVDKWIGDIWNFIQSDKSYKDKTALLITVDHGRGLGNQWTSHDKSIPHSGETWFAIMAPGLPGKGEIRNSPEIYQEQLAQTVAELMGFKFSANHPVSESILKVLK